MRNLIVAMLLVFVVSPMTQADIGQSQEETEWLEAVAERDRFRERVVFLEEELGFRAPDSRAPDLAENIEEAPLMTEADWDAAMLFGFFVVLAFLCMWKAKVLHLVSPD